VTQIRSTWRLSLERIRVADRIASIEFFEPSMAMSVFTSPPFRRSVVHPPHQIATLAPNVPTPLSGGLDMPIGQVCTRDVMVTPRDTTVADAAKLMRRHHVGDLVVVDSASNGRKRAKKVPVGIVTDRDLVISVMATKLDPAVFTVGDLLTNTVVTAPETQGIFETIQQMRARGIRRMPIVDAQGGLVGIISVDDLVQLLGEELGELGKLISREQAREVKTRQ
jgi:CBS domain-containing protein